MATNILHETKKLHANHFMIYTIYQVDAFTDRLFGGNPAAVVPLKEWIDDALMQKLAMENNLSETVFFVPSNTTDADYEIRWFTPVLEINLCGHATLASAFVLFNKLGYLKETIRFQYKSGLLSCIKRNGVIEMDFPAWKPEPAKEDYSNVIEALGRIPVEGIYKHRDVLVEVRGEELVRMCAPDFTLLKKIGEKVIITSRGNEVDFVSRFFAPVAGIDEDPVTGSAHSQLIPFWAEKSGKNKFHAKQLSERGGELWCQYLGERVTMAGKCVFYMKGEIEL
ncbi:MAG TPA: PhzF family phenazine biosynthesis protein [Flavitalea sp.]|nr:PhzF family phenazine biosynthesis protein [Flavitalea sp.]